MFIICRFEREGEFLQFVVVDFFVSTVDLLKEFFLIIGNIVLLIFVADYFVDKVFCYVFDDGVVMFIFELFVEIFEFARKWVSFCKKFVIELRVFEFYFLQKIDYFKDKV